MRLTLVLLSFLLILAVFVAASYAMGRYLNAQRRRPRGRSRVRERYWHERRQ